MKTTFLIFLGLVFSFSIYAQIPTNGLIGKWSFNNANALDEVGSDTGTVNGAILTTDRFGNADKAYYFDGINDEISLTGTNFGTSNFAISVWFKADSADEGALVSKYTNVSSQTGGYSLQSRTGISNNGGVKMSVEGDNGVAFNYRSAQQNDVTPGEWHHAVLNHNYSNGTSLYVDGVLSFTNTGSLSGNIGSTQYLSFGKSNSSVINHFQGAIDDVLIYNRELTASEITAIFNDSNPIATGTANLENISKITLSPNPVINSVNFSEMANIRLTNISGLILMARKNVISIDLSELSNGFYFMTFTDENGKVLQQSKIVKQ